MSAQDNDVAQTSQIEDDKGEISTEKAAADADREDSLDRDDTDVDTIDFKFDGDIRGGYFYQEFDFSDGSSVDGDSIAMRVRYGTEASLAKYARFKIRLAAVCGTDSCTPRSGISSIPSNENSIRSGNFAIDEAVLHFFRLEKVDLGIGRMQTRAVAHGGVYAKSLDRNNSNNINVTWTDGMYARYTSSNKWVSNLIVQRNYASGTGSVTRFPLDFGDSSSRVSYFYGLENTRGIGPFNQFGFDITYMPDALLRDGDRTGRIDDYLGLVGRFAAEWPKNPEGMSLIVAGEYGYAPETQTKAAAAIGAQGDVDGDSWFIEASLMNFKPGHSVGINYARTEAGWLLSPQYQPNEEGLELRYVWRLSNRLQFDARARWREELDRLVGASGTDERFDAFARLTWQFETKRLTTSKRRLGF